MTKKEWGHIIWYFFHTLAYKLKDTESTHANYLLEIFISICHTLPCPYCRTDAVDLLKKANTSIVKTKPDLIRFMWQFHNIVNKKLGKRYMTFEKHNVIYENASTIDAINTYIGMLNQSSMSHFAISDARTKQQHKIKMRNYLIENKWRFNP